MTSDIHHYHGYREIVSRIEVSESWSCSGGEEVIPWSVENLLQIISRRKLLDGGFDDSLHGLGVGQAGGVEFDGEVGGAGAAHGPRPNQTHHHVLLVENDERGLDTSFAVAMLHRVFCLERNGGNGLTCRRLLICNCYSLFC